jgi:hypothetical protein
MADERFTGGCLCEGIQFEITPPTKWCGHCHCTMCRRAHGAGVVTWFGVQSGQMRLTRGEDLLQWYQSSAEPPRARRGFCRRCGSMMFFEGERWAGETHVARASVAGSIDREPTAHVFYDGHVPWLSFGDELKKLGGPSGMKPIG